jgi:GWxTD domain-containing protein
LRRNLFVSNGNEAYASNSGNTDVNSLFDVVFGYSEAQLDSFLGPMMYIATGPERDFVNALRSHEDKKRFFWKFWADRRTNPEGPVGPEWQRFYEGVRFCNTNFGAVTRQGWQTERGRVFLTYGPPNYTETFEDPLQYHIWSYNSLRSQQNVIFVFYSRDRATNELLLLHSSARGEPFNPQWKQFIDGARNNGNPDYGNVPVGVGANTTGGTRFD